MVVSGGFIRTWASDWELAWNLGDMHTSNGGLRNFCKGVQRFFVDKFVGKSFFSFTHFQVLFMSKLKKNISFISFVLNVIIMKIFWKNNSQNVNKKKREYTTCIL